MGTTLFGKKFCSTLFILILFRRMHNKEFKSSAEAAGYNDLIRAVHDLQAKAE